MRKKVAEVYAAKVMAHIGVRWSASGVFSFRCFHFCGMVHGS